MPTRTHSRIDQEDVVSEERSDPGSVERREVFPGLPGGPGLDEERLEVSDEALDALLSGARTAEEIAGPDGLLGQLTRRLLNRALEAELSEHLGYEAGQAPLGGVGNARNGRPGKTILTDQGPLRIGSARDRKGTFEPQIVRKRQTRWVGFDDRVLGLWFQQSEGAKFWLHVLTDLKHRGVSDILFICVDGLTGFVEAIEAAFPAATVQTCLVHQVRSSLRFVSYKDRKPLAADLRKIYTAVDAEHAADEL